MAKIGISSNESVFVNGVEVNLYKQIKKCKSVERQVIKRRYGNRTVLVDPSVHNAIKIYVANDGFAGMQLYEYLDKLFGGVK